MISIDKEIIYPVAGSVCAGIAAIFDIQSRKIPNRLIAFALPAALLLHLIFDGWSGLATSFAAALVAGGIFFIFFVAGGMGGGDVKLISTVASAIGFENIAYLLIFTSLVGGLMGLVLALVHGRLRETMWNVLSLVRHHHHKGLTPHEEINVKNSNSLRLPYAVAIAAGCLLTSYFAEMPR